MSVGLSKRQRGEPEKSFEVLEVVDDSGPGSRQGAVFFFKFSTGSDSDKFEVSGQISSSLKLFHLRAFYSE